MTTTHRTVVYVSCAKGDCIDVLALDRAGGTLSRITTVALPGNGMPLATARDRRHLYAAVAGNGDDGPRLSTFAIDQATGALDPRGTVPAPGRMSHITVDRSGRHLLGASVANDLISSHAITVDGALASATSDVRKVPSKAHHISTDLGNRFVLVPNLGADLVSRFRFDADGGRFEPCGEVRVQAGAAPRHMVHHPNGRFAYLLCEEDGTIIAFTIDAVTGALAEIQKSDFLPAGFDGRPWGAQILTTPDGRFLYASERRASSITLHAIDPATGRLQRAGEWMTESCPRNFTIDSEGRHLIAGGEESGRVACYAINARTGHLEERSTIATGAGPIWIEAIGLA